MSYITFNRLGVSADLGSQIQQYASMLAVAKKTKKQIVLSESSLYEGWGIKFPNLLNIEDVYIVDDSSLVDFEPIHLKDGVLINENAFSLNAHTNYCFFGLFHMHHYWYNDIKEDVFNLTFNEEYQNSALEIYNSIKGKELVSIHIRRGDYLQHDNFCKLNYHNYYKKAIDNFDDDKYRFVVFSNDVDWCKHNIPLKEGSIFINPNSGYVDLILMSMCQHNIIANSSFSWWAAFFNKNKDKQIICPTNYVNRNDAYSFLNGNYYPQDWKNIDNL
jgi:hypothetical protein